MEETEIETEEDYLDFLNQVLFISLDLNRYYDTAEAGYPEKFESIIGVQN